jgi:hypothetical protein
MPPTPKQNKSTNDALFNEIDPAAQVSTIKENLSEGSSSLIDTYAVPILIELIRHELSRPKGGLGNHEALAAHAMRYARAAITERDRPFKPSTVAVAQGVPTQPQVPVPYVAPIETAPSPLSPEVLPPGMSAATPDELRELMRG